MTEILRKSAYAAHHGKSPAAVSAWIRRGQLTAPALRADGCIDVTLADRQLGLTVDPTRSAARQPKTLLASPASGGPASSDDDAARQLMRAKAVIVQVQAMRAWRELQHEKGRYMLAEGVKQAWTQTLREFAQLLEEAVRDLADELGLDQAARIAVRKWWRRTREKAVSQARAAAAAYPEYIADPEEPCWPDLQLPDIPA